MKASLALVFSLLMLFTSCRKEPLIAPANTNSTQMGTQNQNATYYKGEKVIYFGLHKGCEGAVVFKKMDGHYLRAISYPKEVLNLKKGDTLYIEYELVKLQTENGIEFGTKPIEVTGIAIPKQQDASGNYSPYR